MTDLAAQILVLAKEPVPGRVKTRLTPPFTPREAAALAEAALADTLAAVRRTRVIRRVLALAGEPGPWLPEGFDVIPQRGAGLDERIAAAMWDAYTALPVPIVLIGMDTPQVTAGLLELPRNHWPAPWRTPRSGRPKTAGSGCSACAGPIPS